MKFTDKKVNEIQEVLHEKKVDNPMSRLVAGIGVGIDNVLGETHVMKDNNAICSIEDLGRMIEELTMLKEAIEEQTGIEL